MGFLGDNVSKSIHKDVMAVGHRIVHGLDIHNAVLLTDQVIEKLRVAATLAPLHNPPGLQGIAAAQKVFSGVPQVMTSASQTWLLGCCLSADWLPVLGHNCLELGAGVSFCVLKYELCC